jgi:hypothetical protein
MYLLSSVIDSLGDQMREHYASLHPLLANCLRDSNPSIRSSALRATSALIPWLVTDDDIVCICPTNMLLLFLLHRVMFLLRYGVICCSILVN